MTTVRNTYDAKKKKGKRPQTLLLFLSQIRCNWVSQAILTFLSNKNTLFTLRAFYSFRNEYFYLQETARTS